ncbi:amidohydrolase, imidazolonepropionase [Halobacteroides halobius DSM 5150]|uniref:Amidohydrolase, imidazolonepropionase n=1 Tax=Halobacteroides halobius (strain ATCC 35273 / DSM 5150 / MD-1) TaxID=748449 RepID=L0KB54_HALHC|nr:amidohydrolase [Halobacteroides halobius]AGB41614.1 amidohydrolase, imidazolonepropionase [Halobacteroides halobius DSM 5150]
MLALVDGKILTMNEEIFATGSILIENGKIKDIGDNIDIPTQAEKIDLAGQVVMPGIIDAHTHLGVGEEGIGWEGQDYNEMTDPITPHLRAIDGINPEDEGFVDAYQSGITTAMVSPGSANVLGGECTVVKTKGQTVEDMILKKDVGIKAALGENPKRVYNEQNKAPSTRMAVAALLRQTLLKTEDYIARKEVARKKGKAFERDLKLENMTKILNKEIPLKAHAHQADDIMTIIRIAEEFDIDLTLEHCTAGHKIADQLAKAKFPAVVGPTLTGRIKVELKDRTFKTPGILSRAGLKVAIMSDHPASPIDGLLVYTALAVKSGMDRLEALKAITINPAQILGVADRVGSIEKGKDADLVVFNGDPLAIGSKVNLVLIDGDKVN